MMEMSCDSEQNYKAKQTEDLKNGDHLCFSCPSATFAVQDGGFIPPAYWTGCERPILKGCLSWTISDKLSWTIRDKQKENLTLN